MPADNINETSIYDFLESRRDFLDGVVISGGEPTLQKDLIQVCEKTKKMGYPVKLDTNGSRPEVVQSLIDKGLVDYVAMDIKTSPALYSSMILRECSEKNIMSSIQIIMESNIDYEFRTTCIKPFIDKTIVKNIAGIINGAKLYAMQKFQDTNVLDPEFFQGHEYGYSDNEMEDLKSIAEPWVKKCLVR